MHYCIVKGGHADIDYESVNNDRSLHFVAINAEMVASVIRSPILGVWTKSLVCGLYEDDQQRGDRKEVYFGRYQQRDHVLVVAVWLLGIMHIDQRTSRRS